jgi:hypothetical protein
MTVKMVWVKKFMSRKNAPNIKLGWQNSNEGKTKWINRDNKPLNLTLNLNQARGRLRCQMNSKLIKLNSKNSLKFLNRNLN